MATTSRHLLFIALLPLLPQTGCFTPEYGGGGFLCAEGLCPQGYGCICSGGKSRCEKGAADSPCILPDGQVTKKDGGDGPPPGGAVICSAYKEVSDELMLGAGTFDMALDRAGNPVLVWVTNKGAIAAGNPDLKATAWPLKGLIHPTAKTQTVAAAINNKDHLSIVFPNPAKSGTGVSLWHDTVKLGGAPFTWTGANEVSTEDMSEVALAGAPGHSTDIYLAATEKGGKRKLVARLTEAAGVYSYSPVCTKTTTGAYHAPHVVMGKHKGSDIQVGLSFHDAGNKNWELSSLKVGAKGCPTDYPLTATDKDSPAAMAFDGLGGLQIAWGLGDNAQRSLGPLKWIIWPTDAAINKGSETTIQANTIVDPRSISLAMRKSEPCIASWEYIASPSRTDLRISCSDGPKNWKPTTIIDTIQVGDAQYRGYPTRLMTDAGGKLHLAYMVHKIDGSTDKVSLRYVSCE